MGRRKAAVATLAGSSMSTLIAAVQAILLLPICIRLVGDSLYGSWLATGDLLLCLCAFDFGLPNLMIQRAGAAHAKKDFATVGRYFTTGFLVLFAVATTLLVALFLTSPAISRVFAQDSVADQETLSQALRLAAVATALTLVNYGFQGLSRAIQKTLWMNITSVVGTLAGFAVTYALLLGGQGLNALAIGLIVRGATGVVGGLVFLGTSPTATPIRHELRWDRAVWRDYLKHSPALFASGVSYALMTNSQIAIAALLLDPKIAVVFSVTRRAAELGKSFLDMIGYASVGGVAHLTASADPERIKGVYRELDAVYFASATAIMSAYIAGNASFVHLWMGEAYFGGILLTVLMGLRAIATGWSYFEWSLMRASGQIQRASLAVIIECAARLTAMIGLTLWLGIYGLPLSGILCGLASGVLARRTQFASIEQTAIEKTKSILARSLPLGVAILIAMVVPPSGWLAMVLTIVGAGGFSVAMSLSLESPMIRRVTVSQPASVRRAA